MKSLALIAGVLALSACAQDLEQIDLDDIRDARGDLPGVETAIDCDRAPRIVFDKNGEIVEEIQPIRHPSCPDSETKNAGLVQVDNMYLRANSGPSPFNEASDDDNIIVVVAAPPTGETPTGETPTQTPTAVIPCTDLECEPEDVTEWVAWRKHFGIATTQQDIDDHVKLYGGSY